MSPHLPEFCFAVHPTERTVIAITRGEKGYAATTYDNIRPDQAEAFVTERNAAMAVDRFQQQAMVAGSMFGWDCPGADPDYLRDQEGRYASGQITAGSEFRSARHRTGSPWTPVPAEWVGLPVEEFFGTVFRKKLETP